MTAATALMRLRLARAVNEQADKSGGEHGFGTSESQPIDVVLRTIMAAVWCGLRTDDWAAVAEGYDMMVTLHRRMTGKHFSDADLSQP